MARRRLLLLALALAACQADPPQPATEAGGGPQPDAEARRDSTVRIHRTPPPPTPFDAATAVFDTVEPPEQTVQIPPRPEPRPPRPRPTPPPPPPTRGPSGSCDVRSTEGYCFAYTGDGWTPEAARGQCAGAPDATFGTSACPLDGRIATCTFVRPSAPGREIVYTYYAPYDPTLAELACPGTFTRIEGRRP